MFDFESVFRMEWAREEAARPIVPAQRRPRFRRRTNLRARTPPQRPDCSDFEKAYSADRAACGGGRPRSLLPRPVSGECQLEPGRSPRIGEVVNDPANGFAVSRPDGQIQRLGGRNPAHRVVLAGQQWLGTGADARGENDDGGDAPEGRFVELVDLIAVVEAGNLVRPETSLLPKLPKGGGGRGLARLHAARAALPQARPN